MAEEKREGQPDKEVTEILSDLEAVLSDLGGGQPSFAPVAPPMTPQVLPNVRQDGAASAPPPPKPPAPAPKPVVEAPPALRDQPIELGARSLPPAKTPEKKPVPPPKPAAPTTFSSKPPIELGLEGGAKTGAAQPASRASAPSAIPTPAAVPPPAAKPAPVVDPAPAVVPPPAAIPAPEAAPASTPQCGLPPADALPDIPAPGKVNKDQIRRVAFLYLRKFQAERDSFAKLLDQTAETVPKKPLFLRRVLYQEITEGCEGKDVLARILQAKAVAALGIVEGLSEARLRELSEALAGGSVMFRPVAPLDVGKRSVAIDIVVDVMLLPSEAP